MEQNKKIITFTNGEFAEKMTPVRKATLKAMTNSKQSIPHITLFADIDVTKLVSLRANLKEQFEAKGIKLTYLPFITNAVMHALKKDYRLNIKLKADSEEIVYYENINLGIAMDTPLGLLVPVMHNAETKGVEQMAIAIADLHTKAINRKLTMADITKATFTITNFGSVGLKYGTPIINSPESAILGIGAIETRAVLSKTGELENRSYLPLSLSVDHRIIDGADGGRFIQNLKALLENPELLIADMKL